MARKKRPRAHKLPNSTRHARHALDKFAAGDAAAAAKHCRLALKATPDAADLWHLLSASLLALQDYQAAEAAIQTCRRLAPTLAEYHNTDALITQQQGDVELARRKFGALLSTHSNDADAHYNLGRLLLDTGNVDEAVRCFTRACELRPKWLEAWQNLGHARFAQKEFEHAQAAFLAALEIAPRHATTLLNLGNLCELQDDFVGARECFQLSLSVQPDAAILLRLSLLRPIFTSSAEEIAGHRARIEHDLALIKNEALAIEHPVDTLGAPTFYFAYHGLNDRHINSQIGDILTASYQPPRLPFIASAKSRHRVAVVSAHLKNHAIGRLYAPLLEQIPRDDFELAVLSIGQHDDPVARRIAAAADLAVSVDEHLDRARTALNELDADIIFYPDVGMEANSFWLAAERHASTQCLGWGHPVTSGLSTLDYFISSTHLEPPNADEHYCETLHRLPSWPVVYEDPGMPDRAAISRRHFGLDGDKPLYLCPQSLFKLHPDFDACLAAIAALDPDAQVVLLGSNRAWQNKLRARFARHSDALAECIHFLPALSPKEFYALIADADVVLDTVHFSGGLTSFETIWAERPFVTERASFMRGRVTAGLCDLLELTTPLADGPNDYAERAVSLAHPGALRDGLIAQLAQRKPRLLEMGPTVSAAYVDFFNQVLAEHASQNLAQAAL